MGVSVPQVHGLGAGGLPVHHIAALSGADAYTGTISTLESLLVVRVLEVGLLAVAVFYILNGCRLLLVDLGVGLERQDVSFYASLMLTGAIVAASVPTFLAGVSL